jgi:hypothetical protein
MLKDMVELFLRITKTYSFVIQLYEALIQSYKRLALLCGLKKQQSTHNKHIYSHI